MTRLIDADALKENMKEAVVRHICTNTLYNTIMAVIDGAPTVEAEFFIEKHGTLDLDTGVVTYAPKKDVVEVVRCKDCKWYYDKGKIKQCTIIPWRAYCTTDDGFCSCGERKEE